MKIAIGSDHGGFELKNEIVSYLKKEGYDFFDFGCYSPESMDYPDIAKTVAEAITKGEYTRGFLICGTGIGISMAANKMKGIRAACCSDTFSSRMTRMHNDANILCMGGRVVGVGLALDMAALFLTTDFEGDRHQRRIDKITALEA